MLKSLNLKSFSLFLIFIFMNIALLAGPHKQAHKIPSEQEVVQLEKKLIVLINAERAKNGLADLKPWDKLSTEAKVHSVNMAAGLVAFGHDGFNERAKTILSINNVKSIGENVAYNSGYKDYLSVAVKGWMKSPGHRENILGNYNETGIGIAFSEDGTCYLTQLFARRAFKGK